MSQKDDAVAAAVAAITAGQAQVLADQIGSVFDQGEAIGTGPGFTQADIDAAVAAAVAPLNQSISDLTAKDASDIQAGTDALAALQASFDKMSADKAVEDGVIAGLQSAKDSLAAVLASLSTIGVPAPAPTPAPVP